jgi:hypothetical protein
MVALDITRAQGAAVAVLAAAVITVGGVGFAVPADAAPDQYIALSYSLQSQKSGSATADSENAARIASLQNCQGTGGNQCVTYVIAKNQCAAIAVFGTEEWTTGTSSELALAQKQALNKNPGGRLGASGCATSLQVPPPDQSAPPDAPPPPPPPPPPVENDYDDDGLSKHDELYTHHTNPFVSDTDLDGVNDGDEVRTGTNPLNHFSP